MRTLKLTLAYDGTDYAGWQVQPGQATLQDALEPVLAQITGEPIRVVASGRTDAGVHALGQVVSFRSETPPAARGAAQGAERRAAARHGGAARSKGGRRFHATRDAVRKRYRYVIHDGPVRDVFARHYVWHYRRGSTPRPCTAPAQPLVGKHDFCSFETSGSERASSVRTVFEISRRRRRGAAGASLDVRSRGRRIPLQHGPRDRRHAGGSGPRRAAAKLAGRGACRAATAGGRPDRAAAGLFLVRVDY